MTLDVYDEPLSSGLTGTPPGVGSGIKPEPVFLKVGDVMDVAIEGLGAQKQKCVVTK